MRFLYQTLPICFFFILLLSCSSREGSLHFGKEKAGELKPIQVSVDTALVDAGDEFLYLQWGLFVSDVSKDGKYLYNYDMNRHRVEKIDLENMRLEEIIPFEKEGPHGVGQFVNYLSYVEGDFLVLSGYDSKGLFDLQGKKVKDLSLKNSMLGGESLEEKESFGAQLFVSSDQQEYFTFIHGNEKHHYQLGRLKLEGKELKKMPLTPLDKLKDYVLTYSSDNRTRMMYGPSVHLKQVEDKILISHGAWNELMVYNPSLDTIQHFNFQSKLTKDGVTEPYQLVVESQEAFNAEVAELRKNIAFGPFVYDPDKQLYYRLSDFMKSSDLNAAPEVYLSVFDQNFQLIGEKKLDEVKKGGTSKQFAKDGKLYIFENLEDELAFVVVNIEI